MGMIGSCAFCYAFNWVRKLRFLMTCFYGCHVRRWLRPTLWPSDFVGLRKALRLPISVHELTALPLSKLDEAMVRIWWIVAFFAAYQVKCTHVIMSIHLVFYRFTDDFVWYINFLFGDSLTEAYTFCVFLSSITHQSSWYSGAAPTFCLSVSVHAVVVKVSWILMNSQHINDVMIYTFVLHYIYTLKFDALYICHFPSYIMFYITSYWFTLHCHTIIDDI